MKMAESAGCMAEDCSEMNEQVVEVRIRWSSCNLSSSWIACRLMLKTTGREARRMSASAVRQGLVPPVIQQDLHCREDRVQQDVFILDKHHAPPIDIDKGLSIRIGTAEQKIAIAYRSLLLTPVSIDRTSCNRRQTWLLIGPKLPIAVLTSLILAMRCVGWRNDSFPCCLASLSSLCPVTFWDQFKLPSNNVEEKCSCCWCRICKLLVM